MTASQISARNVLVVFGALMVGTRKISGRDLLLRLGRAGTWYTPRPSGKLAAGDHVFFYESSRGIAAEADVLSVTPVGADDAPVLQSLGIEYFTSRIEIGGLRVYEPPLNIRPLVERLEFITNKEYWGQGLRSSPRLLSIADTKLIKGALVKCGTISIHC